MDKLEKNFKPLEEFLFPLGYKLTEEHKANINVSNKGIFYIYNYNSNIVLVPRDDPIIRICRGLVLDDSGDVRAYPFDRFFNSCEPECAKVDFSNADVLEKLDGSLINVWWTGSEWEVTTRGSFYPLEGSLDYKETFKRLFSGFDKLDDKTCYMFEMISKENQIVTRYDSEKVVLIGARNMDDLEEYNQDDLDEIAFRLKVERPRRFKANNVEECKKLFEQFREDEEGLVVVDQNFNRMKIKQESYLKMARIMSLKNQDILDFILGKSELDGDFKGMHDVEERIESVRELYEEVKSYCDDLLGAIGDYDTDKEFAEVALKYQVSPVLFKLRKRVKFEELNIRFDRLTEMYDSQFKPEPKKLLVLRGIPGSGKSTWIQERKLENYTLSSDKLRLMFNNPSPYISQDNNQRVWEIFNEMLVNRMVSGDFTVLDATHTDKKSIKKYEQLCGQYRYLLIIVDFKITLDEGLERNKTRPEYQKVPEDVITKMYNNLLNSEEKSL